MFTWIAVDMRVTPGARWVLSPWQSWPLWTLSPLQSLCPSWAEMMLLKLPAQCKKSGPAWRLRPRIPATGGASLSYIVKLCLKIKQAG